MLDEAFPRTDCLAAEFKKPVACRLSPSLFVCLIATLAIGAALCAEEPRKTLVLEGTAAKLTVEPGGGSIAAFQFRDQPLNPLVWAESDPAPQRAVGHFLCLDRWGPPSDAEARRGMFFHGEATHVEWALSRPVERSRGRISASMSAALPLAGLTVDRRLELLDAEAVFRVTETVTNPGRLGRVYNMVQHPTLGPPFLDESVLVDCNATRGFAQGTPLDKVESQAVVWPHAGDAVDLRRLADSHEPNVVSFVIEGKVGWITAVNPRRGLLIGYAWKTADYPWINIWRHVDGGKPLARGLEFGTTGVHQPFGKLIERGQIFDRPLVAWLDAGESVTRSYLSFLAKVPPDFRGVRRVEWEGEELVILERDGQRRLAVNASELSPP